MLFDLRMDRLVPAAMQDVYRVFTVEAVMGVPAVTWYVDERARPDDASWHMGRVRHFLEGMLRGEDFDPILVDQEDLNSPGCIVLDGNHRFVAGHLAGRATVAAYCHGRVDYVFYLAGKTDASPFSPESHTPS